MDIVTLSVAKAYADKMCLPVLELPISPGKWLLDEEENAKLNAAAALGMPIIVKANIYEGMPTSAVFNYVSWQTGENEPAMDGFLGFGEKYVLIKNGNYWGLVSTKTTNQCHECGGDINPDDGTCVECGYTL